jgi:hypothetical protein
VTLHTFATIDVPWWARAPLGAAAGAAVAMAVAVVSASVPTIFYVAVPAIAAVNLALADIGRRPFSPVATCAAAVVTLMFGGCFREYGAAVITIGLGGALGGRLARGGTHREARQLLLGAVGAVLGPLATLGAYYVAKELGVGAPLAIGVASFHFLYWLPVAGTEATLAWSAARAKERAGRAPLLPRGEDFPCSDEGSL